MMVARLTLLATILLGVSACGITAPSRHDGFADLSSPGLFDTDPVMRISLGPTVLRFAAANVDDDPETEALLRGLDGIRIRIYEIHDGAGERVASRLDRMAGRLQDDGWYPVAVVRDERETMHVLMHGTGRNIDGMLILVADGEHEAVAINLLGEMDPAFFNQVASSLDLDAPDVQLAGETGADERRTRPGA